MCSRALRRRRRRRLPLRPRLWRHLHHLLRRHRSRPSRPTRPPPPSPPPSAPCSPPSSSSSLSPSSSAGRSRSITSKRSGPSPHRPSSHHAIFYILRTCSLLSPLASIYLLGSYITPSSPRRSSQVLPFVAGQTGAYWSDTEGKYRTPVATFTEETGRLITRRRSEAPTNKEYAVAEVRSVCIRFPLLEHLASPYLHAPPSAATLLLFLQASLHTYPEYSRNRPPSRLTRACITSPPLLAR